jgi:hypothetical protein
VDDDLQVLQPQDQRVVVGHVEAPRELDQLGPQGAGPVRPDRLERLADAAGRLGRAQAGWTDTPL